MKNLGKTPFGIKLFITFLVVFCTSTPNLSRAQTLKCTRVVNGGTVHHGKDDGEMGIWFKKIDEKNKKFIKRFLPDHL